MIADIYKNPANSRLYVRCLLNEELHKQLYPVNKENFVCSVVFENITPPCFIIEIYNHITLPLQEPGATTFFFKQNLDNILDYLPYTKTSYEGSFRDEEYRKYMAIYQVTTQFDSESDKMGNLHHIHIDSEWIKDTFYSAVQSSFPLTKNAQKHLQQQMASF